ncbi:MAG: single-stranded-DNA-specific exonuclease RecJ [Clostridiaceae bacterium]|nr:single-stranded-DNA-specific exonuclease RecJ [Clostridiaceae bacterium]
MENYYLGNGKRWTFTEYPQESKSENIPEFIYKLLLQRNIKDEKEALSFLNPDLDFLHDPFLLEGMDIAVERIIRAIQNNEKVLVYGDYDVDGVVATSILVRFFKSQNIEIDYYIPDRIDEGYGISDIAVDYIIENNYDLVITVDCGITALNQVNAIYEGYEQKEKNIDIIITDHHQFNEKLMPKALVVIDPHIPYCNYPFKFLCGAGLALKLVQALCLKLDIEKYYEKYFDMVALATIADIVDLTGENRVITRYGIERMTKNPCTGIEALIKVSQLNNIDSYRVSFALAPRVNAAGRMGHAKDAVELFITDDELKAQKIATFLNEANLKRKEIQDKIFNEVVKIIEEDPKYKNEKIIVVWGENFHHGVVGIVASKLVDHYHKPAIVLSIDDGKAVGSARSIDGFNLFNALSSVSDILVKFGGHEQAGGLSLNVENLGILRERINIYADQHISYDMLIPSLYVNLELEGKHINLDNARLIRQFEPFGSGNPKPVFCVRGAKLETKKVIGNGKHLKLSFEIDGNIVDGVYFSKGHIADCLFVGDVVDIIFTQEINEWQNTESVQIRVLDMRLNETQIKRNRYILKAIEQVECLDSDANCLYNGIIDNLIEYDDIVINRSDLALIYKYIIRMNLKRFSTVELFVHSKNIENATKNNINCFKFFIGLLVFEELGLLELILNKDGTYEIIRSNNVQKVNLEDSELLDWIKRTAQGFKP